MTKLQRQYIEVEIENLTDRLANRDFSNGMSEAFIRSLIRDRLATLEMPSSQRNNQTCYYCGETVGIDLAVAFGWQPDFWMGDEPANAPCCPNCAATKLIMIDDEPCARDSE